MVVATGSSSSFPLIAVRFSRLRSDAVHGPSRGSVLAAKVAVRRCNNGHSLTVLDARSECLSYEQHSVFSISYDFTPLNRRREPVRGKSESGSQSYDVVPAADQSAHSFLRENDVRRANNRTQWDSPCSSYERER